MRKLKGGNMTQTVYPENTMKMPSIPIIPSLSANSATISPSMPNMPTQTGGKKRTKKGGALMDDVQKLAVPFAILLAKQGLDMAYHKKEKKTSTKSTKSKITTGRKASVAGGDCQSCNKKGGAADIKNRFAKLSKQIDDFLKKY
jgi:hypothetical protein